MGIRDDAGACRRKGDDEMSFLLGMLAGIVVAIVFFAAVGEKKPKGPYIALDTPCPACGHMQAKLKFVREQMQIYKICQICGCQTTQPPVAPSLFKTPSAITN